MSNDPRLFDFIEKQSSANPGVNLIGFPTDAGVKINGGRTGASKAPKQIYEALLKLTPDPLHFKAHTQLLNTCSSYLPVECMGDVLGDQKRLGKSIADLLKNKQIPIILGGGHETSYGHFLGYAEAGIPVSILNIDAHTDVRKLKDGKAHSGSSFFQALNHPDRLCKSYNAAGLNPSSVSEQHYRFVQKNGQPLFERETDMSAIKQLLDKYAKENIMITMDMDAVKQGDAPGVSAPNSSGISKKLWLSFAFEFGKCPGVTSFDICEVNPEYDRDNQTVKLAALTVWNFLLGLSLRE